MAIRKRGTNTYTITIYIGREGGKRQYYYETFYGTLNKARHRAAELEVEIKSRYTQKGHKLTLNDYLDIWLESIKDNVTERTLKNYTWHVSKLKPIFNQLILHDIRPGDILLGIQSLEGISPRTKKDIYSTLRCALRQSVRLGYLKFDPSVGLKAPRVPRREEQILNHEELGHFLKLAKDYKHYPVIRMLAVTGMRLGEALGLKWKDIDVRKCTITIRRAVDCRKRIIKNETKTASSMRTIKLDQETLNVLQRHKQSRNDVVNIEGLIFQAEDGRPLREGAVRNCMNRILKKAGLKHIRIHDLRHTAGSILLDEGLSLAAVASFLGHSTPATTASIYAHTIRTGESIAKFIEADNKTDK